jgi:hypothetical protein
MRCFLALVLAIAIPVAAAPPPASVRRHKPGAHHKTARYHNPARYKTPHNRPGRATPKRVIFPAGGAADLLKVTKPFNNGYDDATREGMLRQNVETTRLLGMVPDANPATAPGISIPIH